MQIKPKLLFITLFAFLLLIISYKFFTLLEFPDSSIVLEKGYPLIKLKTEEKLTQRFSTNRNNLMKIQILFRTPLPENPNEVQMQIAEQDCQKILRKGNLEIPHLSSDNLLEFSFPKIADSENKTFCLIATFKPKKSDAKAVQFFSQENKQPVFLVENLTSKDDLGGQALSMRPVYSNDHWSQDLSELNQRISQYKPWFLKHFFLAAIAIAFVVLSIGLVTIIILL